MGIRKLPLIHTRVSIFPGGNLTIPRPKLGPVDLHGSATFLVFVTGVFVVLGVLLIALRHSSYGRRLAAMKDSPAACATLGQNLVRLKLSVFMLSAAIAGLGGALMSAQLGSVDQDRFDIFLSLGLLMLTVVGGIGYVSGALFGGILSAVAFVAIQDTFTKLGVDHATLHDLFSFLARFTLVLPALIGVSMGRNPSGAVSEIVRNYAPLRRAKPVVAGGLAALAAVYLLASGGTISNWWFVVLTAVVLLALPAVAKVLMPDAFSTEAAPATTAVEVPLELVGLERPFTLDDRAMLDQALGLTDDGVVLAGAPAGERASGPA